MNSKGGAASGLNSGDIRDIMQVYDSVIIFGGTGFIGTHLTQHLLRHKLAREITLVDLLPPREEPYANLLLEGIAQGAVRFVKMDVRDPILDDQLPSSASLIVNLAAILREPGHRPEEYYETNVVGGQNVIDFASRISCEQFLFTSSISPYGPSEEMKDEGSLPVPETNYGCSKLVAEKIHLAWLAGDPKRKLLVVRPGVVYGPGENGNLTRLIRSLVRGYFIYVGNRKTRKAGGYVKELCNVCMFGLEQINDTGKSFLLLNFSVNPVPTMEEFVSTIRQVAGVRRAGPFNIPRSLLLGISYPIGAIAGMFGIKTPIHPVRVRKLFRSTAIDPKALRDLSYTWRYTLAGSFEDWKNDAPGDFA
jgi:GlcNAc-P-P-Und epimerase